MFDHYIDLYEEVKRININLVNINKIINAVMTNINQVEDALVSYLPKLMGEHESLCGLKSSLEQSLLNMNHEKDDQYIDILGSRNEAEGNQDLLINIKNKAAFLGIDELFNVKKPVIIAGPCAIENEAYLDEVARFLKCKGIKLLRGGAFKPRTSPYSFQGLGEQGLEIINRIGKRYDLITISEVLDTRHVEMMTKYVDILQIGSRNMHNIELLKEVGRTNHPILLKRGFGATVEEFTLAAEYIAAQGNQKIILCERGIRTFETSTRNTLDIGSIAIIKKETSLPIIVDLSHSLGRRDIVNPIAGAVIAAGADGIMVEVHPKPELALSDSRQQLNLKEFYTLLKSLNY